MPVFQPTAIAVSSKGENVLWQIGNSTLTMHYEDAFTISQWIRLHARDAKRRADGQWRWGTLGTLEDLNKKRAARIKRPPAKPLQNVIVRPSLMVPDEVVVTSERKTVLLTYRNTTLTMHWKDALTISQWIRIRAKEAQRFVQDPRHWSTLTTLDGLVK